MKILILTANLGNFDKPISPVPQQVNPNDAYMHVQFNDGNFKPITGLTPRLQYRIPKLFGLEMVDEILAKSDVVIWYDGSMSLQHPESIKWFLEQLGDADMALFKHPWRNTVKEEVDHIEEKLQEGNSYITSRYKNGLHKEMYAVIEKDTSYRDDWLFASTAFIYRNTQAIQKFMQEWWYYQSRYYTCDQVALPYALYKTRVDVNVIDEDIFKIPYISLVSKHK